MATDRSSRRRDAKSQSSGASQEKQPKSPKDDTQIGRAINHQLILLAPSVQKESLDRWRSEI
jgi:hypothetical protein